MIEAVKSTDLSIVCVGTPSRRNGALSLAAIEAVSTEIGQAIRSKPTRHEVVIRSTVLPGTTRDVILPRLVDASGKNPGDAFGVAFNPEFMREGSSVQTSTTRQERSSGRSMADRLTRSCRFIATSQAPRLPPTSKPPNWSKYVDNTWHALKVAFTNEIAVVASTLGIDSDEVMSIFSEDNRLNISKAYMRPGFAFGGSCLPKDLRALAYLARTRDLSLPIISHILDSNRMLTERGLDWILAQSKKRVAFLGISFKPGTDDVRESPFVDLVERLSGKGRAVRIFDPNVNLAHLFGANRDYLMRVLPHIAELLVPEISDATDWADTIVVTSPDPIYAAEIAKLGPHKVVLDLAEFHQPHPSTSGNDDARQLSKLVMEASCKLTDRLYAASFSNRAEFSVAGSWPVKTN